MPHPTEHCELTNLCMLTDDEGRILVQDRTDPSWPGICFPGGHVEPGESFVESAIHEVQEETGLTILDPILCGIKQFPLQGEDAMSCCCFGPVATGTLTSSAEGEVFWLPRRSWKTVGSPRIFPKCCASLSPPDSANSIITGSRKPGNGSTVCCKRQRD